MASYTITADSLPDYDSWGPDDYWSCEDWVNWHKALKTALGKEAADSKWLSYWNEQDSFEHDYNWCKYAANFNSYVQSENLPVSHLLADVVVGGTQIGENTINTVTTTSKIIKYVIPILIVVVIIGALFYFGRKYKLVG